MFCAWSQSSLAADAERIADSGCFQSSSARGHHQSGLARRL